MLKSLKGSALRSKIVHALVCWQKKRKELDQNDFTYLIFRAGQKPKGVMGPAPPSGLPSKLLMAPSWGTEVFVAQQRSTQTALNTADVTAFWSCNHLVAVPQGRTRLNLLHGRRHLCLRALGLGQHAACRHLTARAASQELRFTLHFFSLFRRLFNMNSELVDKEDLTLRKGSWFVPKSHF